MELYPLLFTSMVALKLMRNDGVKIAATPRMRDMKATREEKLFTEVKAEKRRHKSPRL